MVFDSKKVQFPGFLSAIDDRFFVPNWWKMDGQEMEVFCLDVERSIRAGRPLLEVSYCMTKYLNGIIAERRINLRDHKWESA